MSIQIDKNVPIPKNKASYPWDSMEVGDSFFIEGEGCERNRACVSANDFRHRKSHPEFRIKTRMVNEGGVKGFRVWRTA